MTKKEVDAIIDSFTNPMLFEQNENGIFARDMDGNLIRKFPVE